MYAYSYILSYKLSLHFKGYEKQWSFTILHKFYNDIRAV